MNKEKLLVLVYKDCKVIDVMDSAGDWVKQGWGWQFREKNKDLVVVVSVGMEVGEGDKRFKVAGKEPAKVFRVNVDGDKNGENRNNGQWERIKRKNIERGAEGENLPRKVKRDLMQEFREVENESLVSEDDGSVLKNYNRITPAN